MIYVWIISNLNILSFDLTEWYSQYYNQLCDSDTGKIQSVWRHKFNGHKNNNINLEGLDTHYH